MKGEIEKTSFPGQTAANGEEDDEGDGTEEEERKGGGGVIVGGGNWVELSIDIPGSRDDDAGTAFLGSMIHEAIVADGMLKRRLWINGRWHWRLFVDVSYILWFFTLVLCFNRKVTLSTMETSIMSLVRYRLLTFWYTIDPPAFSTNHPSTSSPLLRDASCITRHRAPSACLYR